MKSGPVRGALTIPLAALGRSLRAIDIDEHRIAALRKQLPEAEIACSDALIEPLNRPVVVGNLPFHLTTPLLRRLLTAPAWRHGIVLVQWGVARKRAGIGGATLMTAQAGPWFTFELHGRVPASGFTPRPSVDAGILAIHRREHPLMELRQRRRYEDFVRVVFTGRGRGIGGILRALRLGGPRSIGHVLQSASLTPGALPRDLSSEQWAALWHGVGRGIR